MSDYQEARKKEARKDTVVTPAAKAKAKTAEQNASCCPACGAAIPDGALFCPECGLGLNPAFCPNCGAQTSPGADICPACFSWLLEGQCKFCYAEIAPDAAFCPNCGNPKDGILCPDCGSLSIFDFCTSCGKPLTEGAALSLQLARDDPDAQAMVAAVDEAVKAEAELAKLETLINSEPPVGPAPPPVRKSLFSERQLAAIMKTGENRDAAMRRREEEEKKAQEMARLQEERERLAKIQEAKRHKEEIERKKAEALAAASEAMKKFKGKTFISHQDARRFHNAMRPARTSGWLCNYTNTVHSDGPNGCDQPGLGGYWYDGGTITVERRGPA